jgi:hypothetical protein
VRVATRECAIRLFAIWTGPYHYNSDYACATDAEVVEGSATPYLLTRARPNASLSFRALNL